MEILSALSKKSCHRTSNKKFPLASLYCENACLTALVTFKLYLSASRQQILAFHSIHSLTAISVAGSLKAAARELARYKLDIVGEQVSWDKG